MVSLLNEPNPAFVPGFSFSDWVNLSDKLNFSRQRSGVAVMSEANDSA
jgi:hypothetical protein